MALEEIHQKAAIDIVQRHRKKKNCNKCYDRGYVGFTAEKTIVPCEKCVDLEAAMAEWKEYVAKDDKLKEEYKELFEDEQTAAEPESEEHSAEVKHTVKPERKDPHPVTTKKNSPTNQAGIPRRSGRRSS